MRTARLKGMLAAFALVAAAMPALAHAAKTQPAAYAGSSSCRECHERFCQLWSTSLHGLAMQPFTSELMKKGKKP